MNKILLLALFALILAACAADPRNEAEAYSTRLQAEQTAQDTAQARTQAAAIFELQQTERAATSKAWAQAWANFLTVAMWAATAGSVAALLAVAAGVSFAVVNTGRAVGQAALVRANLIYMDPQTRSYPFYLQHIGNGKFTLTDMATGQVKQLDISDRGHRQLIAGANIARLAGTVAHEARHHKTDPAGVWLAAENSRQLIEAIYE